MLRLRLRLRVLVQVIVAVLAGARGADVRVMKFKHCWCGVSTGAVAGAGVVYTGANAWSLGWSAGTCATLDECAKFISKKYTFLWKKNTVSRLTIPSVC